MLGWEFFISRKGNSSTMRPNERGELLARWRASPGGTEWIDELVARGDAIGLGGNGYPIRYTVPVGVLAATLSKGLPKHEGPPTFGDDYFLPSGWTREVEINLSRLRSLDPQEVLEVEAWDQS